MGNCTSARLPNSNTIVLCEDTLPRSPSRHANKELSKVWPDSPLGLGPLRPVPSSSPSGLSKVAECCQPLLFEIVEFLAESPKDFAFLCGMSARFLAMQMRPVTRSIWKGMYARRWPAFHDSLCLQGFGDWCHLYRETLNGRVECTLEVFDREKKLGFAMSAMPARLQYDSRFAGYVARYLSASEVPPEKIPSHEEARLRFCPLGVRAQLLDGYPHGSEDNDAKVEVPHVTANSSCDATVYPYRVLQGVEGLEVGCNVELQWKMQEGSPFGWWFGQLEALSRTLDGLAQATITFRHFPAASRWYRLEVTFGDSRTRDCAFGGYTGGIRAVSEPERLQCVKFFPKEPVVF